MVSFPLVVFRIGRNQTASDKQSLLPKRTRYWCLNRFSSHVSLTEAVTDLDCLVPLRIQLENVAVVSSPWRGCWRFVPKHCLTAVQLVFMNVCHQPVSTARVAGMQQCHQTQADQAKFLLAAPLLVMRMAHLQVSVDGFIRCRSVWVKEHKSIRF